MHRDLNGYSANHTRNIHHTECTVFRPIAIIERHRWERLRSDDTATTFLVDDSITRSVQEKTFLSIV